MKVSGQKQWAAQGKNMAITLLCLLVTAAAEGMGLLGFEGGECLLTSDRTIQSDRLRTLGRLIVDDRSADSLVGGDEIRGGGKGGQDSNMEARMVAGLGASAAETASAAAALAVAAIMELEMSRSTESPGSETEVRESDALVAPEAPICAAVQAVLPPLQVLVDRIAVKPETPSPGTRATTVGGYSSRVQDGRSAQDILYWNGGWGRPWGGIGRLIGRWHGLKDGYVGVLTVALRLGGPAAMEEAIGVRVSDAVLSALDADPESRSAGATVKCCGVSPTALLWLLAGSYMCLPGELTSAQLSTV